MANGFFSNLYGKRGANRQDVGQGELEENLGTYSGLRLKCRTLAIGSGARVGPRGEGRNHAEGKGGAHRAARPVEARRGDAVVALSMVRVLSRERR